MTITCAANELLSPMTWKTTKPKNTHVITGIPSICNSSSSKRVQPLATNAMPALDLRTHPSHNFLRVIASQSQKIITLSVCFYDASRNLTLNTEAKHVSKEAKPCRPINQKTFLSLT